VPLLPRMTALENVMLAAAARGFRSVAGARSRQRALGRVGAASAATRRTEVMSTSEVRLVALARALVGAPAVAGDRRAHRGDGGHDAGAVLSALLGAVEVGGAVLCHNGRRAFAGAVLRAGGRACASKAGGCSRRRTRGRDRRAPGRLRRGHGARRGGQVRRRDVPGSWLLRAARAISAGTAPSRWSPCSPPSPWSGRRRGGFVRGRPHGASAGARSRR